MEELSLETADFRSSDMEFSPSPQPKSTKLGLRSLELLKENAAADRISSKKAVKKLKYVNLVPREQYRHDLWMIRFRTFRDVTLNVNLTRTPTTEQIQRFLYVIVNRVRPQSSKELPTVLWLKKGVKTLVRGLEFDFPEFSLSKHERLHIDMTVTTLLKEGKLTQDTVRPRHWAGVILIRRMITVLLQKSLDDGTRSWDLVLQQTLSISLLSALQCRVGDITKSSWDDHKDPFLQWRDIDLRLHGGANPEHLVGQITIRNEKNHKQDPLKNRIVSLNALPDANDNVLCVVKYLLIMALRLGNVTSSSIEDLLQVTALRGDKKVQWIDGGRPVLLAFSNNGHVVPWKPADGPQLTKTCAEVSQTTGILARILGHDIRRGAAKDLANLNHPISGFADFNVAQSLGHSFQTLAQGVTADYVGYSKQDLWRLRVENTKEDPFEPRQVGRERQIGSKPENPRKRTHADAQEAKKRQAVTPSLSSTFHTSMGHAPLNVSHVKEIPIDPLLLELGGNVGEALSGLSFDDETIEEVLDTVDDTKRIDVLHLSALEFMSYFSKINVFRRASGAADDLPSGNSRDAPCPWQVPCKNAALGCRYQNASTTLLKSHEITCRGVPATPQGKNGKPRVECPSCFKTFSTNTSLKRHMFTHKPEEWVPKPCNCLSEDCDPNYLYPTAKEFNHHLGVKKNQAQKQRWKPQSCPIPDCPNLSVWKLETSLRSHLRNKHQISGEATLAWLPVAEKDDNSHSPRNHALQYQTPRSCPLEEDCPIRGRKRTFKLVSGLRKHLTSNHHGLSLKDANSLLSIT